MGPPYTLVFARQSGGSSAEATALTMSLVLLAGMNRRPSFRPYTRRPFSSTRAMPHNCRLKGTVFSRASMRRPTSACARTGRTGKMESAARKVVRSHHTFPSFQSFSVIGHSGIHAGIEQVGNQVHQHEDQTEKENAALNRGKIALVDGGEDVASHAGPGENGFRQDRAREIAAEVEAQYREHRQEGVAK